MAVVFPASQAAQGFQRAAERLAEARATGVPCAPVRDLLPPGDLAAALAAAYAAQSAWVAGRVAAGARVVGRKVGLTNPAVQAQLGVDQPDFGVLLDEMDRSGDREIDPGPLLQPRIEAEVAFGLSADLTDPDADRDELLSATAWVAPALEVVDSRVAGWDITIVDTVADNASAGVFVVGPRRPPAGVDLVGCAMTMWRGDDVVATGTGAACLGDPVAALAWLAGIAREQGHPLRAGDVVLSGALGPVAPVAPGDSFRAEITGLGAVVARFGGAG